MELAKFDASTKQVTKDKIKIMNLNLGSFKTEWVFDQAFDEHQD